MKLRGGVRYLQAPIAAVFAFVSLATGHGVARDFSVGNSVEFTSTLRSAGPGDVIFLRPGTWTNADLEIGKGGSAEKPLIIRAETPGATVLTGRSHLVIKAPYVVVEGLLFQGGAIEKGAVILLQSHHGIVRDTAVIDYNPARFDTGYYWAFFAGNDNLLERCFFRGKNHLEPVIGNAITGSARNTVRNCYLKDIPYAENNGRECIRVWGAGKFDADDSDGAYFTIEGNLFDHADGEGVEIISLKSNYNRVLNNTVIATRGGINIRQGSHNLIAGNIILGQRLPGTEGLRMSGSENTVRGNYVSGCDFGIRVSTGEYVEAALTDRYEANIKPQARSRKNTEGRIATYPQVRKLTLSDNVVVNCKGADLEIGFAYRRHWPKEQLVLLPEDCVIRGNRFVRPKGGSSVIGTVPDTTPPLERFRFAPNLFEGNRLVGGENNYAPAASGFTSEKIPVDWSEEQELPVSRILGPKDVGPVWMAAPPTAGRLRMN